MNKRKAQLQLEISKLFSRQCKLCEEMDAITPHNPRWDGLYARYCELVNAEYKLRSELSELSLTHFIVDGRLEKA